MPVSHFFSIVGADVVGDRRDGVFGQKIEFLGKSRFMGKA
jgi:hypothetical protein